MVPRHERVVDNKIAARVAPDGGDPVGVDLHLGPTRPQ